MTSRCAACRYLRRRCPSDCIFSPYFPPNNPQRFACVHRIYGASNVGRMLRDERVPVHVRGEVADSLFYEAQCRIQNPVHGCVGIMTALDQQICNARIQLQNAQAALLRAHAQGLLLHHQTQYDHQPNSSAWF